MRIHQILTASSLALLCSTGALAVPDTFLYVGDLDEDGAPADGSFSVTFQMFNHPVAGSVVFAETVAALDVTDGVMIHELGSSPSNPLDDAELAAGELYLSVIVNGTALEPRVAIRSVPFATRAEQAAFIGGTPAAEVVTDARLAANDVTLPANSVGSTQITNGAISTEDFANRSVTTDVIAVGTLTKVNVKNSVNVRVFAPPVLCNDRPLQFNSQRVSCQTTACSVGGQLRFFACDGTCLVGGPTGPQTCNNVDVVEVGVLVPPN